MNQATLFGSDYPETLYNGKPPHEASSETSREAAESVAEISGAQRQAVADLIVQSPRTDDEIEVLTGYRHQSCSARRRELVLAGVIEDSGEKRLTRSGRKATVWRLVAS